MDANMALPDSVWVPCVCWEHLEICEYQNFLFVGRIEVHGGNFLHASSAYLGVLRETL